MVKLNNFPAVLLAVTLSSLVDAHPEGDEMHEALEKRDEHAAIVQRGLESCVGHPNYVALQRRGQERRWQKAQTLRQARGIEQSAPYKTKRDLAALEAFEEVNHNETSLGYSDSTSSTTLFASYKNASCILTPEVTDGPYFVTGEYYRTNVTDGQEGVPVHLEYQYIDISTCDVATGLYLETWHANATGVYSGVVASGNGDDTDTTNLDKTFLRGVTMVNDEGVAAFDTIFAGHYDGRATHIHLIAQQNGTVWENGTYSGGTVSHVGQLFFDEELKAAVEATYPYNTNAQAYTTNDEDMWAPAQADNNYDPLPEWAYLNPDDISDGLLMWISVGINMSAEYTVSAAATLTADGGVTSSGTDDGSSGSQPSDQGSSTQSGGASMQSGGSAPTGSAGMQSGSAPTGSQSGSAFASGSAGTQSGSGAMSFGGASTQSGAGSSSISSSVSTVSSESTSSKVVSSSSSKTGSSSSKKTSSTVKQVSSSSSAHSSSSKSPSTSPSAKISSSIKKSSSTKKATSTKKSSSSKKATSTKKPITTKKSTNTHKPTTKKTSKRPSTTVKQEKKPTSTKKSSMKTVPKKVTSTKH